TGGPCGRRAGGGDRPAVKPWNPLAGAADVEKHGPGLEGGGDGLGVRLADPGPGRVVGIVLETREEEAEVTISARGRPPVEGEDGGAVGARRRREGGQAGVEGGDPRR